MLSLIAMGHVHKPKFLCKKEMKAFTDFLLHDLQTHIDTVAELQVKVI